MKKVPRPSYDLEEIKRLLQNEATRTITRSSRRDAVKLRYADDEEMVNRVLKIIPIEFSHSMISKDRPILNQDVYITCDGIIYLYIKLQKSLTGKGVIVSFKEDT